MSLQSYVISGPHDRQETAHMSDGLTAYLARPLTFVPDRIDMSRRMETGEYASTAEMRESGFVMNFDLDGYGRLFGRWPEGTDPVALVPVRDDRAA